MPGADPVKVNRHPAPRRHFRRVQQARSVLERESKAVAKALIEKAKGGDRKAAQWVLEHVSAPDADGNEVRPIAAGIDKQGLPASDRDTGPRVLIGVSLGGDFARLNAQQTPTAPALPPATSQSVSARALPGVIIGETRADRVLASREDGDD